MKEDDMKHELTSVVAALTTVVEGGEFLQID